jgi:hypothetical protein
MSDKEQRPADGGGAAATSNGDEEAALSVVSGLMDERRRFESWLAALEARRATTDERVFTRVHADYTMRLEAIIAQLSSHAEGLRGELTNLAMRLTTLRERQHQAREERAEAELRSHVGELSGHDWEQMAAALDARMASLAESHVALETELHRTRELLADAERPVTSGSSMPAIPPAASEPQTALNPPTASAPPPAPAAPSAPVPQRAQATPPSAPSAPAPSANTRSRTGSFDELAFLSSVVDTPGKAPERAPSGPPVHPTDPGRRDSYAQRAVDDSIENLDGAPAALVARTGGDKPMAANISGNNPIVIKEKAMDGSKTLKCAECGSMNYPTEWYCERCGAELASL